MGGTEVAYVVQPWTAGTCDEPDVPPIPPNPPVDVLAAGRRAAPREPAQPVADRRDRQPRHGRLVRRDGSEIEDTCGCTPCRNGLDTVTVGDSSQNPYYLQREFNNAGDRVRSEHVLRLRADVILTPAFVVPSSVDPGDEVQFDGSAPPRR